MEARAIARYVRVSPRKARVVVDLVRGKSVAQAREILRHAVHQHDLVPGGEPLWEPKNGYIRGVPGMKISDPSYHLPHFYDLVAEKADPQDREFWRWAAQQSRDYIARSADPKMDHGIQIRVERFRKHKYRIPVCGCHGL